MHLGSNFRKRWADNAMNSTPSCANAEYQNGVLRDSWGWGVANSSTPMEANSSAMSKSVMSPYIVSDCSAIGDMATGKA